jgi:hypothetical protein
MTSRFSARRRRRNPRTPTSGRTSIKCMLITMRSGGRWARMFCIQVTDPAMRGAGGIPCGWKGRACQASEGFQRGAGLPAGRE